MSQWARDNGLEDLEQRIASGTSTPEDMAFMQQVASVPPGAGPQAVWNNFVTVAQDRANGSGGWLEQTLGGLVPNELRPAFQTARDLTGNSLGIPGADPGILNGSPSPLSLGALLAGGAYLGAGAVGAGGMTTADAATLGSMTEGTAGAVGAGVTGLPMAAAPAAAALPAAAGADIGGGLALDAYGNVAGGAMGLSGAAGGAGALGAGAAGAGGSVLSRLLGGGSQGNADLINLLGTLGAAGLGVAGSNAQSNALHDIYSSMEAKREPYRAASLGYLNDPSSYINGPGQTALQGVLRGLSVHGNPVDNPTSMGIATQAALSDWRNAVTGFGNLGLSGEDTRANVASNAANAGAGAYDAGGYALGALTQPRRRSLSDLLGLS